MFTAAFWKALAERAIKTFAQSAAALLVVGATSVIDIDWQFVLGTAGLTTLASILTTLGSGVITGGNASLAQGSEVTTPPGSIAVDPNDDPNHVPL